MSWESFWASLSESRPDGGRNPAAALNYLTDVNCAVQGAYYSTGQRCTASSYGPRAQGTYAREFYTTVKAGVRL